MKEKGQILINNITRLYEVIGILQNKKIDEKTVDDAIEYFENGLYVIDVYASHNNVNSNTIDNSIYSLYNERKNTIEKFLLQLKSFKKTINLIDSAYEQYQTEKNKDILSSFNLEYEKEYHIYQGAKVINLNFNDKKIQEKLNYLLLEISKNKLDKEEKHEVKEEKKETKEEKKEINYINLDIPSKVKIAFEGLYGRNNLYLKAPYNHPQSIASLNEMNEFFLENNDVVEYIKNIDINLLNPSDKEIVLEMKKVLNDIDEYKSLLVNNIKTK